MTTKQINHQEFYDLSTEDKKGYIEYIKGKIVSDKMVQVLLFKMAQIVKRDVTHYESDFYVHDYNMVTNNPYDSNTYVWIVYDCGSHLIPMERNFEEEANLGYDYYKTITKNNYSKGAKTYLLNVIEQTVKVVDPASVQKEKFSNRNGDIKTYFDSKIDQKLEIPDYLKLKNKLDLLMSEYGGYPTKEKIDEIF